MNKVLKAIKFATKHHEGQKRSGTSSPYIVHPLRVLSLLLEVTDDEDILCAGVLHDVVEDTPATLEDIESEFGYGVRELVDEVSDDMTISKKEARKRTLEKIPTMHYGAQLIKTADSISNVEDTDNFRPATWKASLKRAFIHTGERGVNAMTIDNPLEAKFKQAAEEALARVQRKRST
jgi:myo-inositol-1(or 4)-monophosphatase